MNMEEKKPNWYVRILLILLCIFLCTIIAYNFFAVDPKGAISAGLISLVGVLVVLVLSESFDIFSLGKIISIQREAKKTEAKAKDLEKRNAELLNQLIQISTSQNQQQATLHVFGDYHAPPSIKKASQEEIEEQSPTDEPSSGPDQRPTRRRMDWRKVGQLALHKYLDQRRIHPSNVITDAKLTTQFHGLDPVSNYDPIFDGYFKGEDEEVFIEFRPISFASPMFRDRLYVMLTKINYYRNVKKTKAVMDFVLMKTPEADDGPRFSSRWLDLFQPAIADGMLRIHEIEFSEEELKDCFKE